MGVNHFCFIFWQEAYSSTTASQSVGFSALQSLENFIACANSFVYVKIFFICCWRWMKCISFSQSNFSWNSFYLFKILIYYELCLGFCHLGQMFSLHYSWPSQLSISKMSHCSVYNTLTFPSVHWHNKRWTWFVLLNCASVLDTQNIYFLDTVWNSLYIRWHASTYPLKLNKTSKG